MKFSSPIKRKKLEIKPVKLSYYNHSNDTRGVISSVPRKYRSSVKIVLAFILLGALITVIYYLFTKYRLLQVTEVQVSGKNNYVSVNEVRGYMENKTIGSSIFKVPAGIYEQTLVKEFLGMEKATVKKKYPNKLIITVAERNPVAVLVNSDKKYLVDKDGYVIKHLSDNNTKYSEIIYSEEVFEGQFINQSIVPLSVELLKFAKDSSLEIKEMQFNSQYITLKINDNIEVDLSLAEDNAVAMKQIAAIIEKTSLESQKLRKIDLRFEKVIVLYD